MANIKSAKKRILQSNKKRIQNKSVRSETKTEIKKFLQLHGSKVPDEQALHAQLRKVEKLVDKAAGKGVIHKNKAARIKSRLRLRFNVIGIAPNAPAPVKKETPTNPEPEVQSEETQLA